MKGKAITQQPPPQPPYRHPILRCEDCNRMLDQGYRRRPCPWCGSLVKKFDYGTASVIRYPEIVSATERVINQSQWWWLTVPVILTGVSAWLCFLSLPPLLAAIITVAIGVASVFIPPWRSKIVEHVKQII